MSDKVSLQEIIEDMTPEQRQAVAKAILDTRRKAEAEAQQGALYAQYRAEVDAMPNREGKLAIRRKYRSLGMNG